jgi:hypothetical protein
MDKEAGMIRVTNGVAAAGIVSPAWFPKLEAATLDTVSAHAAAWVPILSAVWLGLQIVRFLIRWGKSDVE